MNLYEEGNDSIRSSRSPMFLKIGALKKFAIFTGKHLCWGLFLIKLLGFKLLGFYSKEAPKQVFSCEHIVKILSTPFFYRTPLVAAFLLSYCFLQPKLSCTPVIYSLDFFFFPDVFFHLLFLQLLTYKSKIMIVN